jgi:hypothetical protein
MKVHNSVRTAQRTQRASITNTDHGIMYKEIMIAYFKNHMEQIKRFCKQNFFCVKQGGMYSNQKALNG